MAKEPIVTPGKGYVKKGTGYVNPGKGFKQTASGPVPITATKPQPTNLDAPTSRVTNKKFEDRGYARLAKEDELAAIRKKAAEDAAAAAANGGGGGGGGLSPLDKYTQQLQGLLTGGSYADPYNDLMKKFQGLFDTQKTALQGINTQAGTTINDSMNGLETMLKGQANPYANLQAQNVNPTAQLSSFLQGQNVGDQQTQDYAQVLNAQNAGAAGGFNNLADVLRSIATASNTGAIADVGVQRDASTRQLANNNAAAGIDLQKGAMTDQRDIEKLKTTEQSSLMKQLLAAIAKGGVPKKGKLF